MAGKRGAAASHRDLLAAKERETPGTPYRGKEITRLEFGNEHEETLATVADADGSRPAEHPGDGIGPGVD